MTTAPPAITRFETDGVLLSRPVVAADLPAIEALHDLAFGPGALTRAAYRVREGQPTFTPFCRVLYQGDTLIAAIRYTAVHIGGSNSALMLGPLAVAPAFANLGHGRRLLAESIDSARAASIALIILIGDPPYYARFGFVQVPFRQIQMPGPIDPARLLALELAPGALATFKGSVAGAK